MKPKHMTAVKTGQFVPSRQIKRRRELATLRPARRELYPRDLDVESRDVSSATCHGVQLHSPLGSGSACKKSHYKINTELLNITRGFEVLTEYYLLGYTAV
jgi:hypothetical protein